MDVLTNALTPCNVVVLAFVDTNSPAGNALIHLIGGVRNLDTWLQKS
jgi:hypothetical protein